MKTGFLEEQDVEGEVSQVCPCRPICVASRIYWTWI